MTQSLVEGGVQELWGIEVGVGGFAVDGDGFIGMEEDVKEGKVARWCTEGLGRGCSWSGGRSLHGRCRYRHQRGIFQNIPHRSCGDIETVLISRDCAFRELQSIRW